MSTAPRIADYTVSGFARGAQLAFTFDNSIFPQLLDFDVPFSRARMDSQAGGESSALASVLYPGDLIASQAAGFPGIQESKYPPSSASDADMIPFPPAIGPIQVHTGSMSTSAKAATAQSTAIVHNVTFGQAGAPHVDIASLRTASGIVRTDGAVTQTVETLASGIALDSSPSFRIDIASIRATATALSDGTAPDANGALQVGRVTVTMNGTTYDALINDDGVHLTGFPSGTPSSTAADLDQSFQVLQNNAGISVRTGSPVDVTDDSSAQSSVGGLVIGISGRIPYVSAPDAVAEAIATLEGQLPQKLRQPLCFQRDISSDFPLPLCIGPNALPGPGSGTITTLSIGNVQAAAGASVEIPTIVGGEKQVRGDEGSPGTPGTYTPGTTSPGYVIPPKVLGSAPQTAAGAGALFGLVARLGSGPLAISGAMLAVLAVLVGMGPSLRQWRLPGNR